MGGVTVERNTLELMDERFFFLSGGSVRHGPLPRFHAVLPDFGVGV